MKETWAEPTCYHNTKIDFECCLGKLECEKMFLHQFVTFHNYQSILKVFSANDISPPGFNINEQNTSGQNVLHITCKDGNNNMVKQLMVGNYRTKKNLNVFAQDNNGRTALHLACEIGNVKCADFIMKYLMNSDRILITEVKYNMGLTPLQIAVSKGHAEIAHLFFYRTIHDTLTTL